MQFCFWLESMYPEYHFRLPTESEWEYAAKGNTNYIFPWGNIPIDDKLANYKNPDGELFPIGKSLGRSLYCDAFDMAGNAYEWCYNSYYKYTNDVKYG